MESKKEKQDNLLSKIGLKSYMVLGSYSSMIYDRSQFVSYVSSEYKNSQRKEVDEVYRMSEIIILHNTTGLRIGYTTTKSFDEVVEEYKLNDIFIITNTNESHNVMDMDLDKEVFFLKNNTIPFREVSKLIY